MKLVELEINNIRGIQHLLVHPNKGNFLFYGPNGSGKSSVVDALDFLLSGNIARLSGAGTGGITLRQHGVRVTTNPRDGRVRGVFEVKGYGKPIQIVRNLDRPSQIDCEPSERSHITPALSAAERGQYILTRRDILRFITAEPSVRAEQVQALLNLRDIEATRRCLVTVRNLFDTEFESKTRELNSVKGRVNVTLGIAAFEHDDVLSKVNSLRAAIDGSPLTFLRATDVKSGINPPTPASSKNLVNIAEVNPAYQSLCASMSNEAIQTRQKILHSIRSCVEELRSDSELNAAVERLELTRKGLALLNESGKCPLCDFPWQPGALRKTLEARLLKASRAQELMQALQLHAANLRRDIETPLSAILVLSKAADALRATDQYSLLDKWSAQLDDCHRNLLNVLDNYEKIDISGGGVSVLLRPDKWEENSQQVTNAAVEQSHPLSPEQSAWDQLTRLEVLFEQFENLEKQLEAAGLFQRRANTLLREFESARDEVLKHLYKSVKDRFRQLYRKLHSSDEEGFDADMEQSGAGVMLKVDFYGHGKHIPHALHSEGHQDSMGVCLFIALSEAAHKGLLDLMVFDDVVMSVDTEHRKHLAALFSEQLLGRQLIITTHDQNWRHELRAYGVVNSKSIVEFSNWKIDTGPVSTSESDVWSMISNDLLRNDVPSAAGRLRRWLEFVFWTVCDLIHAKVSFKADGQYELGDLLPAAVQQYKALLRKAKVSAQSWSRNEQFEEVMEFESVVDTVLGRVNAEQWSINASIHFNAWANLNPAEFQIVAQAFADFCNLFVCGSCGKWLYVSEYERRLDSLRCGCAKYNWSLNARK